ncbi:MAG: transcription-repair coupling factor, partial [Planctomycetes bacterium]|nr:transcription-repair coupling factor [Planctomycetota bacterium]
PRNALIALDRPGDIQEMAETFWSRLNRPEILFDPGTVLRKLSDFDQIHITRIGAAVGAAGDTFHFDVRSLSRFEGKTERALDELCQAAADHRIVVFCNNDGERARLKELIAERMGDVPDSIELRLGLIHRGFEWTATKTLVVGHHELFHRTPTRRLRKTYASRPLESHLDLTPGDLVVHVLHGIAVYRGMKTMQKGRTQKSEEFLTLQFAEKAYLHVSSSQIDLVQKYIGAGGVKPTLSKLGGTRWKKTTERVSEAVSELAESLLRIQALRSQIERNPYPADTPWQREFEDAFIYEDTEDQILVAGEIKSDLARPRPMDRLICGDVGYGKTELAMRAAFKVVEYGKQVAVLVPTTVLAEQHYRTFTERLADYPFIIGCLSRFRTAREQRKLIEQVKKGHIDILIGTHRLLSKDVRFADLALVIIDEEQRFGVEHKERLKRLRETVDVLTLSATPIPRTLHMSLIGLRDISSLATPPMDRRSIATQVINFSSDTIRSGIIRELNRDGQVFFVHNRVRSIEAMAERIRRLVPEACVVVGHGQMREHELEDVMKRFVDKKADVLACTTIIESGLDMPNVNTIFINDADRFGLADLHQLRGRVGRSAHRGYCYFLLPADRPITAKAAKRLKAIEEFSELGAGFRIAMRDLEIRGAGNVLGAEQSGNIAAVGYEMYCQLLDSSVRRLQGKRPVRPTPVHLELDVVAHIPRSYITSERTRIDIYRRIVASDTREELEQMDRDLADAFGKYPKPVQRLLDLAEIRILARVWKIRSIVLEAPDIVFSVKDSSAVQDVFADVQGTVRSPDRHTIHLRPPPNYLEPDTLLAVLRRMLTARRKKEVVG